MKKILLGLALLAASSMATAQGQGRGQELKEEKMVKAQTRQEKAEKAQEKEERAEKEQEKGQKGKKAWEEGDQKRGNAYGKNKEGLSGKEFGQQRAAEAKAAGQAKKEEVKQKIKA